MVKKCSTAYVVCILVQTGVDKVFEVLAELAIQFGRVILRYEEENTHWMQLRVGRLTMCKLDGSDTQRPDVSLQRTQQHRSVSTNVIIPRPAYTVEPDLIANGNVSVSFKIIKK